VIFSDHGWQLGEKEHWRKFALWEGVINSILMVKAPGHDQGVVCSRNVSLVDIFPTLTDLCGLKRKEGISGKSLVPLLKNPGHADWDHAVVTMLEDNHFSIRKDMWHYILYDGKEEELYHLANDPKEWENLANRPEYKSIREELRHHIPKQRKNIVKTKPIRWADVLSGKTKFYTE
jgi:arylsulfatase A-like enzyme